MAASTSSPPATPLTAESSNPFFNLLSSNGSKNAKSNANGDTASTSRITDAQKATRGQEHAYVWTPPAVDERYWSNIAKARTIRSSISKMKHRLSATKQQKKSDEEINRLIEEIRLGERKLMRYVNHYVLNYDDITAGDKPSSVATSKSHELGTISPPMSPSTAPNRPLPLPPQEQLAEGKVTDNDDASIIAPPHLTSRTLPPTPTSATPPIQEQQQQQQKKKKDEDDDDDKEAEGEVEGKKGDLAPAVVVAAAAADWTVIQAQTADNNNRATVMDSQAFITSYKQKAKPGNAGEYDIDSGESSNSNSIKFEAHRDRRKSKINWNGLFGSKNIRAQITNDETSSFSSISNSQPSESPNPSVLSGKK